MALLTKICEKKCFFKEFFFRFFGGVTGAAGEGRKYEGRLEELFIFTLDCPRLRG